MSSKLAILAEIGTSMRNYCFLCIPFFYFVSMLYASLQGSNRRPMQLWTTSIKLAPKADVLLLVDSVNTAAFSISNSPSDSVSNSINIRVKFSTNTLYILDGEKILQDDKTIGKYVEIIDENSQQHAISMIGSVNWIVLRSTGNWMMIPVENLISYCQATCTKLAVFVSNVKDVPGFAYSLQLGVDALILENEDNELWAASEAAKESRQLNINRIELDNSVSVEHDENSIEVGEIINVTAAGIGDRVCLDFTSLLRPGEGVWLGSCARSLALVHAETSENEFVPSRPFRVNSGAVHSYVLMANGALKYLSEIKAADKVRVTDIKTKVHRNVCIGRVKIEPRPLIKVAFRSSIGEGQVFLQQAETVKLVSSRESGWRALSVTEVKVGDLIFIRTQSKGTHVGKEIEGDVFER